MGEYAKYHGHEIKIGTCESMYYLRHRDRWNVTALRGNVDPVKDVHALRFRFPWPDEDHIAPGGGFEKFDRGVAVPASFDLGELRGSFDHHRVQFVARQGYMLSLPCPEGPTPPNVTRNGFAGALFLTAQKDVIGVGVVPILRCACGALMRLEDHASIEALAVAFRSEADRQCATSAPAFYHGIADRLLAGIGIDAGHSDTFTDQTMQTLDTPTANG